MMRNISLSSLNRYICVVLQYEINKVTDLMRHEIAQAGFTECLSFILVSFVTNYSLHSML